ncbi:MAG: endo-1,4-beta-xylanase [Lachnospiraceae bacterium]|nr:endo-1,4-beta-xylanase [Lachnospiraceae bacterium]
MKEKRQKWILPVVLAVVILCGGILLMKASRSKNVDTQTNKTVEDANQEETANVEDKTLSEVKAAREIDANILSDFNSSFEGTDENGLYWWADADWQKGNIQQQSYADTDTSIPVDGEYYMLVSPVDGIGTAQICAESLASLIVPEQTYEFSYWAKLAEGAVGEKAELQIASVNADWSSVIFAEISLDSEVVLVDDNWQQISGTFIIPSQAQNVQTLVRFTGEGENGFCIDDLRISGISGEDQQTVKKEIEADIPNLKDIISSAEGLGEDCYTGASIVQSELSDDTLMQLVNKHFNAVTFGNELKMDALFDYHDNNNTAPGFETISWTRADGTVIENYKVPVLNYSRAESMLDKLKEWNDVHSDDMIKVRGHVLVWHSQAPEWFFHEDWDIDKAYVSAEEMDVRQEWYIKTVLEHFLGEDSAYKDMFYGWDVVNEAVSDSTGTYRNDTENSSWWKVYGNESYIINAFRYANRYAPAELELYYNDYNECNNSKVEGILKLLQAVKSHENDRTLPTRISGMGMQAHHNMSSPTASQIKEAAVAYGKIVGRIQLTELDIKASNDFDGTAATLTDEYTREAYRYKEIYDVLREVDAMDDIDVNNITVWGVIDGNSWLQSSNSAGGASDGSKRQVPLLFDDDYKAKPAFYAFTDPRRLEPYIQYITIVQAAEGDDKYTNGIEYAIKGIDASVIPVWDKDGLYLKISVSDTSVDESDGVSVYADWEKSMCDGANVTCVSQSRVDADTDADGYTVEIELKKELAAAQGFAIDIVVTDADKKYALNDTRLMHDSSSKYFAAAVAKPYITIANAADTEVQIDGEMDAIWESAEVIPLTIISGSPKASASMRALWDNEYLYILAVVTDAELDQSSTQAHEQDSVEVFIDENNHKSDSYEEDDKQYRINYDNEQTFNGVDCTADHVKSFTKITEEGYVVEAAYQWTEITPKAGMEIGLELQVNDCEQGGRIGTVSWYDESGQGWSSPGVFGSTLLGENVAAK